MLKTYECFRRKLFNIHEVETFSRLLINNYYLTIYINQSIYDLQLTFCDLWKMTILWKRCLFICSHRDLWFNQIINKEYIKDLAYSPEWRSEFQSDPHRNAEREKEIERKREREIEIERERERERSREERER